MECDYFFMAECIFCYGCRMMQTTGFCPVLTLALRICGEQTVSFFKDVPSLLALSPINIALPFFFFPPFLFITKWMLNSFTMTFIAAIEWNGEDMLNGDFGLPDVSTPRPQTPPSGIVEVPSHAVNFSQR